VKRVIIFAVAIVFGLALLSRTATYTVRFTEAAILTTFGKPDPGSAVKHEPGLYFKWPEPVQSVTKYDTRTRFLQVRLEQQQTADDRQIVVEPYLTWRVSDPLKFFQRFSSAGDRAAEHYRKAADQLDSTLRSAMSEASKYRLADLFASGDAPSRVPEMESRVLAAVRAAGLGDSGIEVTDVGISRINLPEETTKAVMETMKSGRARLVAALESKGIAEAQTITTNAETAARKIEQFAKGYAAEIRRKGDEEAAQYVRQMNENPELAVFLKNIEFIREAMAKRMTLFFSTDMPGFQLLRLNAVDDTPPGKVPGVGALMETATPPGAPPARTAKDGPP
jgi:membrane protease subunit HflC